MTEITDRIDARLRELGISAAAASQAAGLSSSYIRDLKRKSGDPRFGNLERLATVLGVSLDWLLTGNGSGPGNLTETTKNPSKSRDSTIEKSNASSVSYVDLAATKGIPIVGTVAAGSLKEVADMEDERPEEYPRAFGVHSKRFPIDWQYAMEVEGDSMNQFVPEGSLVVCVDVVASGIEIVSGMKVHIQHFRFGGQVVEQTLKTVHFEKGKMVLIPESTNPKYKPIVFNGSDYDNGDEFDQVIIKGVIIRKMTDETF